LPAYNQLHRPNNIVIAGIGGAVFDGARIVESLLNKAKKPNGRKS